MHKAALMSDTITYKRVLIELFETRTRVTELSRNLAHSNT